MASQEVEAEIGAYLALQARFAGKVVEEAGLRIYCAPQVLPPNNRVTRCLGEVLAAEKARVVLDLGCGTGILALIAARRCEQVIGVDIDRRAVACARRNARLNQIANVRFLVGDAFRPVQGLRFDLIVSNPPFYPVDGLEVAQSLLCERTGQGLLAALIAGAGEHLAPEGKALFVTSSLSDNEWVHQALAEHRYLYSCRLLHQGRQASQDLYLWEVSSELAR